MKLLQQKTSAYKEPQRVEALGLYPFFRVIESDQDTVVTMHGKPVLMFGSNSYMGLTTHPKIKEAARQAIVKYGSGCAGSRFLNGTLDIHIQLEEELARFVRKEAALVFSTGFQVNIGVIPTIASRNDYILIDELDHASIIEACRLSFARVLKFRHNDMASLEKMLKQCAPGRIKLIVVDGVFSMDGDIADLPQIVRLAEQYEATIMVDDAHSIGVLGENGSGTASHFELTDKVDLIMGTFSKSLASIGGFIASDWDTINYIKHHSRSLIFSASITPASAATVLAALEIIREEPERIEKLWSLTRYTIDQFSILGFDIGKTVTPIIPIYIRDNMKTLILTRMLLDEGIFVNPIVPPAVKKNAALIRFSLMATHTPEQIDRALDAFHRIGKKLEII
ncbi:MAG: pyridoxal phosphate-dependent aminotransferase family protein [Bacteroidetes bacterium]|nr:MAG: pyridoxal phosphate-dependent aminotransferase family protein [Bacteroidota bacterium]